MAVGETPGCIGSRVVGVVEIVSSFLSLIWCTKEILTSPGSWKSFNSDFHRIAITFYFLMALVIPILLVYSTYPCASKVLRKQLATLWCAFRGLSIVMLVYLLRGSRELNELWSLTIASGFIIFWAVAFCIVRMYVTGLKVAIGEEDQPPLVRKRKVSSVAVVDDETDASTSPELTIIHMRQLEQFQAYIHRTSWCSNDRLGKSGNRLDVPDAQC